MFNYVYICILHKQPNDGRAYVTNLVRTATEDAIHQHIKGLRINTDFTSDVSSHLV